jgi:hypothetical protein
VSPIICVGQFNHQNHLGKGLSLFPFQVPLQKSATKPPSEYQHSL